MLSGTPKSMLQTEHLGKSDLMISCNFDVPVETDAMPFTQREHKNHSHSYEKRQPSLILESTKYCIRV
jgi:hypothetical protein